MTSSSNRGGNGYSRFIPREELGDFAAWKPAGFGGAQPAAAPNAPPAPPPEPTPEEWRARVAAARQAGYQDGYRDGLVALEGFKQSFAAQATAQVGKLLQGFDHQFEQLEAQIAESVARTAVQLARQVVRHELAAEPDLVAKVAAEAVNAVLLSARHITVRVHPQDLPLVAEGAEEALKARGARLLADEGIERGGVMVDSDVGAIDARVAQRWMQAASALGHETEWGSP